MHVCNYQRYEHVITYKSTNSLQTSFPAKPTMINYQNDGRKENEGSEAKKKNHNLVDNYNCLLSTAVH